MPKWLKWTLLAVAAALVVAIGVFVYWGLTPLQPTDRALEALRSDARIKVVEADDGYEFSPASAEPTSAVVFYPGGHVDVRAYAPLCRAIAERGHLVVLVPMPLSLAVLAPNRAQRALDAHEEIESWAIAGHSLGGAMGAQFASKHAAELDALVLYAAYASGSADLSATDLVAADILGSNDGVINLQNWEAGHALMPRSYTEVEIEGGNHAQFGDYGPQPGDNPATISASEQQKIAADATDQALDEAAD